MCQLEGACADNCPAEARELISCLWIKVNNHPVFGNDDDRADSLMQRIYDSLFAAIDGKPNTKGSHYHLNMLSTTCHIYFGKMLGATPNGRLAGMPIFDGTSPYQITFQNGSDQVRRHAIEPAIFAECFGKRSGYCQVDPADSHIF